MYIIGASGHGKAVIDLFEDRKLIKGILDDDIHVKTLLDMDVLSPISMHIDQLEGPFLISIGNNKIRQKIAQSYLSVEYINVIHDSAIVSTSVQMGFGIVAMERVIVKIDSIIGNHVILNTTCSIDHDCQIGDFAHIAPGVVLCGNVHVGEGTLIGVGSAVLPNIRIGKWCTIAGGSTVHKNMPDGSRWIGNSIFQH